MFETVSFYGTLKRFSRNRSMNGMYQNLRDRASAIIDKEQIVT